MKRWTILAAILVVLSYSNSVAAKPWRGIEPLHSTRADVERLSSSNVVRCGNSACIYDLDEEIVGVVYAANSDVKMTATRLLEGTFTARRIMTSAVLQPKRQRQSSRRSLQAAMQNVVS